MILHTHFVIILVIITMYGSNANNSIKAALECILPDPQSDYTVLITDNESLAVDTKPLVRFTVKNLKNNVGKLHFKPSMYIFLFMDPETLNSTLDLIVNSEVYKQAHFLVLYDPNVVLQDLVDVLWSFKLPNTVLISISDQLTVYTIQLHECGTKSTPKYINTLNFSNTICNPGLKHQLSFNFRESFMGCPLKVLWIRYPPFVNQGNESRKGIFIDFLESLVYITKRELSMNSDDLEYFEDVAEHFIYDAVLEDLKEADLFLSSYGTTSIFYLGPLVHIDNILFIVPKIYLNYWKSFSNVLWSIGVVVAVTIIAVSSVIYYMGKEYRDLGKMLNLALFFYGTLLGNGYRSQLPRFSILRLYFSHLLFLFMVISMFVQGNLVSVLSGSLYEPPITNMQQLIDSQMPFKTTELFKVFFQIHQAFIGDQAIIRLVDRLEITNEPNLLNTLDDVIKRRNYATLSVNALIMLRPNVEKTLNTFPLTRIFTCFAMDRTSFKSPQFYDWILRGVETGFMEKYKKLYHFYLALKWNVEEERKIFILTMDQVQSVFRTLLVLHCGSFLTFLLEVVYYYIKSKWLQWNK